MRNFISIFSICILFSCRDGSRNTRVVAPHVDGSIDRSSPVSPREDSGIFESEAPEFKTYRSYGLNDTIRADLTGDGSADAAFFTGEPRKLVVILGKEGRRIIVGDHKSFDGVANDLSWVDLWGLTSDRSVGENIMTDGEISGGRVVELANPSLVLRRQEEGGGVVTFKNGAFRWIHQAD